MTKEEVIKVVEHHKVGKWKKIKAIQYFVGGYSCSICQTFEEQPLEYCKCCGAKMTNEEAIEVLKDCELNPCVPKDKEVVNMAIKALEQEPRWIPVSERLPTKEEYIANNGLFIVTDGNRTYAEYFDVYNSMKYFGEPTMNGFRVDRCVSAWMPLPEPYREVESEDKV